MNDFLMKRLNKFPEKFNNTKYVILKKKTRSIIKTNDKFYSTINNLKGMHSKKGLSMDINVSYIGNIKNKFGLPKNKILEYEKYEECKKVNIRTMNNIKNNNEKLKLRLELNKAPKFNEFFETYLNLGLNKEKNKGINSISNYNLKSSERYNNLSLQPIETKNESNSNNKKLVALPKIRVFNNFCIKKNIKNYENKIMSRNNNFCKLYNDNIKGSNKIIAITTNREEKIKGILKVKKINMDYYKTLDKRIMSQVEIMTEPSKHKKGVISLNDEKLKSKKFSLISKKELTRIPIKIKSNVNKGLKENSSTSTDDIFFPIRDKIE